MSPFIQETIGQETIGQETIGSITEIISATKEHQILRTLTLYIAGYLSDTLGHDALQTCKYSAEFGHKNTFLTLPYLLDIKKTSLAIVLMPLQLTLSTHWQFFSRWKKKKGY